MDCPNISGLRLTERDHAALDEIRKVRWAGNVLEKALPAGVFATLFLGNKAYQSTYNIASNDWVLFARSMKVVPAMVRYRIQQIAQLRRLEPGLSPEQNLFWRAVERGCLGL